MSEQAAAPGTKRETPLVVDERRCTWVVLTDRETCPRLVQTIRIYFRRVERTGHEQPLRATIGTNETHVLIGHCS